MMACDPGGTYKGVPFSVNPSAPLLLPFYSRPPPPFLRSSILLPPSSNAPPLPPSCMETTAIGGLLHLSRLRRQSPRPYLWGSTGGAPVAAVASDATASSSSSSPTSGMAASWHEHNDTLGCHRATVPTRHRILSLC
jgi:hypothetical protein